MNPGLSTKVVLMVIVVLIIAAALATYRRPNGEYHYTVVVTFANLEDDVSQLLCPGDGITYIAPPGVDPHTYQLTLRDRRILEETDLIISTGHTPFERGIREMVENVEIHARLIEIPSIPGIEIRDNPVTGQPNLHMPIYDPQNYLVFMNQVKQALSEINPSCAQHYREAYQEVEERINAILSNAPRLDGVSAVGATPVVQYAVGWTGINITTLLVPEPDTPLTGQDIQRVENILSSGKATLIIVPDNSPPQLVEKINELATQYSVQVVTIPNPILQGSIPDKLEQISSNLREVMGG